MLIQLARKRKRGSNESREVKVRANSSELIFFSFWFNSINFCLPGVDITTDAKKADNLNTSTTDADKPVIGIEDLEEVDGVERDGAEIDKVYELSTSTTDQAKADRADANRTDKLNIDIADSMEADGADKLDTGLVNLTDLMEADGANKPDTDTAD